MADMDPNNEEIKGKRRRKECEWKKNKMKRLKAEGKEYINTRGDSVPARRTGELCRYVCNSAGALCQVMSCVI